MVDPLRPVINPSTLALCATAVAEKPSRVVSNSVAIDAIAANLVLLTMFSFALVDSANSRLDDLLIPLLLELQRARSIEPLRFPPVR
jgi:hypothetical protein